ncbi:MAG: CpsB/CapC family capsule biosynthesis tyrosine phosphatase, partial [Eubacteriaceae bacterium]
MDQFIDMHSHILSGIDDGSRNTEETKEMLKYAWADGIRAITATPHWNRRRGYTENTASILRSLKTARDLAREI